MVAMPVPALHQEDGKNTMNISLPRGEVRHFMETMKAQSIILGPTLSGWAWWWLGRHSSGKVLIELLCILSYHRKA